MIDLDTTNLGTIITIVGRSSRGKTWMRRNIEGRYIHVDCDHRMGIDILFGACQAGLTLRDTRTGNISRPSLKRLARIEALV